MRILRIDDLAVQPWKNGGGVTRELARRDDDKGMIWRLSIADVERAGPFSNFAGMARVLTVVSGVGLRLKHAGGVIEARPGAPARFDGGVAIDCDLVDGPVRDFNLIYDPARTTMDVTRLEAGAHRAHGIALLPLDGECALEGRIISAGSVALLDAPASIRIEASGAALVVICA